MRGGRRSISFSGPRIRHRRLCGSASPVRFAGSRAGQATARPGAAFVLRLETRV